MGRRQHTHVAQVTLAGDDDRHQALRMRLVACFGIGLLVASIGNGAAFYLKKTGVIDSALYRTYWSIHCRGASGAMLRVVSGSDFCGDVPHPRGQRTPDQARLERSFTRHLYRSEGHELSLKLVKDVLGVTLVLASLGLAGKRRAPSPTISSSWPLMALLMIVLIGFLISCVQHGEAFAVVGLRSFLFVAIAATGTWIDGDLSYFARCLAILLGVELLLMPFEFAYGMHIHGHFGTSTLPGRLSGTLITPNGFGVFAVVALAFHHAFSEDQRYLRFLIAVVAILVALSGSATAWMTLCLFLGVLWVEHIEASRRVVVSVVLALSFVMLTFALPILVGRADLFDSILRRADELISSYRSSEPPALLMGTGIGVGTNTAVNVFGANSSTAVFAPLPATVLYGSESTITLLFKQVGLVGLTAFYWVLAWAFWQDRRARLFFLIVGVSSLTSHVTELFPVNFILGLALAHALWVSTRRRQLLPTNRLSA